jgi:hypothetical protein
VRRGTFLTGLRNRWRSWAWRPASRCVAPCPASPAAADTGAADEALQARIVGILPPQLLQPGEVIILLIKPSPWFILLESLGALAALAAIALLARVLIFSGAGHYYVLGVSRRDATLLLTALVGLRLFWQFLEWLSRIYVLTDRRVIRIQGVFRVHVFEADLKKLQHTEVYLSLRERLFGLGSIGFATAGAFAEAYWRMVAKPFEVHQILRKTIERYR